LSKNLKPAFLLDRAPQGSSIIIADLNYDVNHSVLRSIQESIRSKISLRIVDYRERSCLRSSLHLTPIISANLLTGADNLRPKKNVNFTYLCIRKELETNSINLDIPHILINSNDAVAYFSRGNAYFTRASKNYDFEDYQSALDDYTRAISIDPNHALAHFKRGVIQYIFGEEVSQIQDYCMNSEDEEDRQYLNEHYNAACQHYRDAIADFDRAISIDDSLVLPCKYRAIVKTKLGDTRGAINDYLFIIEMNNHSFDSYCVLTDLLDSQVISENDQLMVEIVSSLKDAYVHLAHEKSRLGDDRGAIEDFTHAITIDRKNSNYYYYRGIVKHKLRDHQGAIEDFTHSIKNKGTMAYYERGITKNKSGDYQGAIEDFSHAIHQNNSSIFKDDTYVVPYYDHWLKFRNVEWALPTSTLILSNGVAS
jgi:tetratricopeptide (TPR) repeat protein